MNKNTKNIWDKCFAAFKNHDTEQYELTSAELMKKMAQAVKNSVGDKYSTAIGTFSGLKFRQRLKQNVYSQDRFEWYWDLSERFCKYANITPYFDRKEIKVGDIISLVDEEYHAFEVVEVQPKYNYLLKFKYIPDPDPEPSVYKITPKNFAAGCHPPQIVHLKLPQTIFLFFNL